MRNRAKGSIVQRFLKVFLTYYREGSMIIGLDVGGTHTDAVLISTRGLEKSVKVPTEVSNLFTTVLTCIKELLETTSPEEITRIVLSTTLTTNAFVQQKLEPVGIIVSSGPGIDARHYRIHDHYYCVKGSIDHRGREKEPVDRSEIESVGRGLKKAGMKHLAVIGKFSVRNAAHELLIKEILADDFERIFMGHNVSGNLNFPRRIATAYLNAAVFSIHKNFFTAVKASLGEMGIIAPIMVLKADGGTMSLDASMGDPGKTILSGPAASIMGAITHAREDKDTLVLDIGGTTTDMAILVDKTPILEPVGIRRGVYKSLIRSLKTYSKGIGGDSEVKVEAGRLEIGPQRKGPAMAFGGPCPTPTDAVVYLGIMDTGDRGMAEKGISDIADKLGLDARETAEKIFSTTCSVILDEAFEMVDRINSKPVYTVHEFLEGYRIRIENILLLGGPGKSFQKKIEEISGLQTRTVPCSAVANAIGAGLARTTCEISLTVDTELGRATAPEEDYEVSVPRSYSEEDVVETGYRLLKEKALAAGARQEDLEEVEVVEFQSFNIVRHFSPKGKIFKTKIQVKPGLMKEYESVCEKLEEI